jgi:hypothetical protein
MASTSRVDLGSGFSYRFFSWEPERDIQSPEWHAKHDQHPDVERAGIIIQCPHDDPEWGGGGIYFDLPETEHLAPADHRWTVESWDPLTLSPSIAMGCGCHGYIRESRWVAA